VNRPRCAVLFALPLDRAGFDAVVRGEALPDYGRWLLGGNDADHVWERRYHRVAAAARHLADVAAAVDARVHPDATLDALHDASSRHDVLILIAHWRGWVVSEDDFRTDVHAVRDRLRAAAVAILPGLRAPTTSPAQLVRALNGVIESGALLTHLAPELAAVETDAVVRATLGRDLLDEVLGDLVVPGNRVELYDGLHSPGAVEAAIDRSFRGEIDLATCTSRALASVISMRRGSAVHIVHTVGNIDPLPCCLLIAAALRHLQACGGPYAAARLFVEEALGNIEHVAGG
jgi:hypothetical protein